MDWQREENENQLELTGIIERPATNAERQRKFRAKKRKQGLKPVTLLLTENEKQKLEKLLRELRSKEGL